MGAGKAFKYQSNYLGFTVFPIPSGRRLHVKQDNLKNALIEHDKDNNSLKNCEVFCQGVLPSKLSQNEGDDTFRAA